MRTKKYIYRIATLLTVFCLGLLVTPRAKANLEPDNGNCNKVQDEPKKNKTFYVSVIDYNLADQILYGKQSESVYQDIDQGDQLLADNEHNDLKDSSKTIHPECKAKPDCTKKVMANTSCKLHYNVLKK